MSQPPASPTKKPKQASKPWLATHRSDDWTNLPRQAIVIGAGLAGCFSALSLAKRGWQVKILERNPEPAQEASGNPQGMLYCKLTAHNTPLSRFILQGYRYTLEALENLLPAAQQEHAEPRSWQGCGIVQLGHNEKERKRQALLAQSNLADENLFSALDAQALSEIAGVEVEHSGLYFHDGGWANPAALCRAILQEPNIEFISDCSVEDLERQADDKGPSWRLRLNHKGKPTSLETSTLIIASGQEAARLAPVKHIPFKIIRGQVSYLKATEQSLQLKTVVCAEGYIAPHRLGMHNFGASFNMDCEDKACRAEDHHSNLALLKGVSSDLYAKLESGIDAISGGRVGFRCTSIDYMPIVGPVADADAFVEDFARLRSDASSCSELSTRFHPGLYINSAHGSRGLISCPLSGELLAAYINQEEPSIAQELCESLHPNRFIARQLIRKQI